MKFIVVNANKEPGVLHLTKYQGKRLVGQAELPLDDHTGRELAREIEIWRKG